MTLVDTSARVDRLCAGDPALAGLLEHGGVSNSRGTTIGMSGWPVPE